MTTVPKKVGNRVVHVPVIDDEPGTRPRPVKKRPKPSVPEDTAEPESVIQPAGQAKAPPRIHYRYAVTRGGMGSSWGDNGNVR